MKKVHRKQWLWKLSVSNLKGSCLLNIQIIQFYTGSDPLRSEWSWYLLRNGLEHHFAPQSQTTCDVQEPRSDSLMCDLVFKKLTKERDLRNTVLSTSPVLFS